MSPGLNGDLRFALDFIRLLDDKLTRCRNRYLVFKRDAIVREAMNWIWLSNHLWLDDYSSKNFYHPDVLIQHGLLDPADQARVKKINRLCKYFCDILYENSSIVDD